MRAFWIITRYARALRFWLYALLVLVAFFGCNEVRAQDTSQCENMSNRGTSVVPYCESREAAFQVISAFQATATEIHQTIYFGYGICGASAPAYRVNGRWGGSPSYACRRILNVECPAGQVWNDLPGFNRCMTNCTARGTPTFKPAAGQMIPDGSIGCNEGCQYLSVSNGDGTYSRNFIGNSDINHCSVTMTNCVDAGYTLNLGLGMCVPPLPECAPNEVKDPLTGMCTQGCPAGSILDPHGLCKPEAEQCPAGMIRSPEGNCLPGEGQCAAGEARKPDGTCGRDSDNDGEPDEFDEDTDQTSFSGGDTCNAPPTCNGDPILCGQARIQWRIECNTRDEATVSGGSCGAVPVCVGRNCQALEYASLLQQWRATCALERLAEEGIGGGEGDDDSQAAYDPTVDATAVADGMAGEGDPADAFTDGSQNNGGTGGDPGGDGELDDSGLGFGTSCPNLPTINVLGNTLDFQAAIGSKMCDWFRLGGQIVLILAALVSLRILSGGATV